MRLIQIAAVLALIAAPAYAGSNRPCHDPGTVAAGILMNHPNATSHTLEGAELQNFKLSFALASRAQHILWFERPDVDVVFVVLFAYGCAYQMGDMSRETFDQYRGGRES